MPSSPFPIVEPLSDPRQPQPEDLLQTDRPGIIGHCPDLLHDPHDLSWIYFLAAPTPARRWLALVPPPVLDSGDGLLTIIATDLTEFVQDASLGLLAGLVIAI
jgi:hypothetical protein